MHKALHPIDDPYSMWRKEGERKLISVEDNVDETIQRHEEYTIDSKERRITAAINSNINIKDKQKNDNKIF